jgi:hypothetical protein
MYAKQWKLFTGLFAMLLAIMVFFVPPALAHGPERSPENHRSWRGGRILLAIAAEEIGLTPQELLAELREEEDRSIADVASAHDVSPDSIVDAVVAKASERLAERVEAGDMSQEEADKRLATIREKVTEVINAPFPDHCHRGRPHRGRSDSQ